MLHSTRVVCFDLLEIDECASGPCLNTGTCTDFLDAFECSCAVGYTGIRCETGTGPLFLSHSHSVVYNYTVNGSALSPVMQKTNCAQERPVGLRAFGDA